MNKQYGIFITLALLLSLVVIFFMLSLNRACKQAGGVTVNRGYDCWVEGRGFIDVFDS